MIDAYDGCCALTDARYCSHLERATTFEDPRLHPDPATGAEPLWYQTRTVAIQRSSVYGLGFVAGSERPVVVRCARLL